MALSNGRPAGVTIAELREFELVQIMARRGQWLGRFGFTGAEAVFGVPPPAQPR